MAHTLTIAADFGARVEQRTALLHNSARAYDQVLGEDASALADRAALFDLRHEYIDVRLSAGQLTFSGQTSQMAATYQGRRAEVEGKFQHFDTVIAKRKFQNARDKFHKYHPLWHAGYVNYPRHDKVDDTFLSQVGSLLKKEKEILTTYFQSTWALNAGGLQGPNTGLGEGSPPPLQQVNALDRATDVFGIQAAWFLRYKCNISIHKCDVDGQSRRYRIPRGTRKEAY